MVKCFHTPATNSVASEQTPIIQSSLHHQPVLRQVVCVAVAVAVRVAPVFNVSVTVDCVVEDDELASGVSHTIGGPNDCGPG